ncbi:DNA-binding response regulator [Parasedimentitalea marina]|uniref:DNA-binding response regulator n=1 Tax=Parasedimentitalea marina TaxID=2483033 RepID=A0A3T0N300_9RHOB|nr:response regulator transcription factor [Parasedimentitalea marina]AZV78416.1 DNA-binding response regulator [Parasedimentitalea marina]
MRVLLVEDDHVLGSAIHSHIEHQGHGVDWVKRLDDAEDACATQTYGLILLDLGLPDGRGLDFLKQLRARRDDTPVIITTAQDQIEVRIEGLNAGADDYLVKPFDLGELTARLSAVARRYSASSDPATQIGDVQVDLGRRQISSNGRDIILTSREWAVVDCLVRNRGAIVPKSVIEDSLYAFGAEIESNAVEVFVSRIRKKLGHDFVTTSRGLGYAVAAK